MVCCRHWRGRSGASQDGQHELSADCHSILWGEADMAHNFPRRRAKWILKRLFRYTSLFVTLSYSYFYLTFDLSVFFYSIVLFKPFAFSNAFLVIPHQVWGSPPLLWPSPTSSSMIRSPQFHFTQKVHLHTSMAQCCTAELVFE